MDVSCKMGPKLNLPQPGYADTQKLIMKLSDLSNDTVNDDYNLTLSVLMKKDIKNDPSNSDLEMLFPNQNIHTETLYIHKRAAEVLNNASNTSAVILISTNSLCVNDQRCAINIARFIRNNTVPHIVIYRYPFKNEGEAEESVEILTTNNIAVFQLIGNYTYFVNRKELFNQSVVSYEAFQKWLRTSLRYYSNGTILGPWETVLTTKEIKAKERQDKQEKQQNKRKEKNKQKTTKRNTTPNIIKNDKDKL